MNTLSKLAFGAICSATIFACSEDDSTTPNSGSQFSAQEIQTFKDSCQKAGGEYYQTPGCNGTAKCKGSYLNLDSGKKSYNECMGKNSCKGIQCIEPNAHSSANSSSSMSQSSSMAMSSAPSSSSMMPMSSAASSSSSVSAAQAQILASPSQAEFSSNCTTAGGKVSEQTCNGHNTCAGLYFHTGAYGTKVGATSVSCQAHNTCAGVKCEI